VIGALASYLGSQSRGMPGKQHLLDNEYFARIDAMTFAINHDDGQSTWGIDDSDVCLVGVSRTSKTPTSLYLANRGIKAANVPFVPGVPLPAELLAATKPLIVGLTNDPERLIHLRRNRLSMLDHNGETDYTDIQAVKTEVREARRTFAEHHWPVIDVTRRSIEETAAAIYRLLERRLRVALGHVEVVIRIKFVAKRPRCQSRHSPHVASGERNLEAIRRCVFQSMHGIRPEIMIFALLAIGDDWGTCRLKFLDCVANSFFI